MFLIFLKSIDLYGSPYHFTIFNNPKYKTEIGGFITILTLIGYALSFWYFGRDFYNRNNPHYLNEKITLANYQNYNIGKDDIMIALRLEDFDGNYIDPTGLLSLEINYYNYSLTSEGNFIGNLSNMDFMNCTMINKEAMRLKSTKDLSMMTCIHFNNTHLGGYWDGDFLNYITINFKSCINSTDNNNICYPKEFASKFLSSKLVSFNIYTGMYYTDLKNYENPLKLYNYNVFGVVDPKLGKNIRLYYKLGIINTDMGILTEEKRSYSVYGLDYTLFDTYPINPPFEDNDESTSLAMFEVYLGKNIETFNVSYIKLQEIIATIGGFLSLTTFLLTIIANFFNEHYRKNEIINHLFDFNDLKDDQKVKYLIYKNNTSIPKIEQTNNNMKTVNQEFLIKQRREGTYKIKEDKSEYENANDFHSKLKDTSNNLEAIGI
jgi:hypothetical protein